MADYQQGRLNGSRPNEYGHASNNQRDAAFSNIFGAAPPPGRSQTMNSSVAPPERSPPLRTQTMDAQTYGPPGGMQRQPLPRSQPGYPPPSTEYMPNGTGGANGPV